MVRLLFIVTAILMAASPLYSQNCNCEKIQKRNEKHGDGKYHSSSVPANGANLLTDTYHPYTTFDRESIGGQNSSPISRLQKIQNQIGDLINSSGTDFNVRALYEEIYENASESLTSTNCEAQATGFCENSRIAKNAGFVYLSNVDDQGDPLTTATSQAFKVKAIRAIMRLKGNADENDVLHWTLNGIFRPDHFEKHFIWHTKSLIMYLQAYDYLMTGLAANPLDTYADSIEACGYLLQCYAQKIYHRADHASGYLTKKDTRGLYTAGALGLAAVVLNGHGHKASRKNWHPIEWAARANTTTWNGLWGVKKQLGFKGGMAVRADQIIDIDTSGAKINLAGYAEGPFQYRLAFENLTPYFYALKNAHPDPKILLPNYNISFGTTGQVKSVSTTFSKVDNYLYDEEIRKLYQWFNLILFPDGTSPAYDQSPNGSGFPGAAMLGDIELFNNYHAELNQTDFIDLSAEIVAVAATGFFNRLKTNSRSLQKNTVLSSGDFVWKSSNDLKDINHLHQIHMKMGYFRDTSLRDTSIAVDSVRLSGKSLKKVYIGASKAEETRKGWEYNESENTTFTVYAGRTPLILNLGNNKFEYTKGHFEANGFNRSFRSPTNLLAQTYRGTNEGVRLYGVIRKHPYSKSSYQLSGGYSRGLTAWIDEENSIQRYGPWYQIDDYIQIQVGLDLQGNIDNFIVGFALHGNGSVQDSTLTFHGNGNFTYTYGCKLDGNSGWAIAGKVEITGIDTTDHALSVVYQAGTGILSAAEMKPQSYYSDVYSNWVTPTVGGEGQVSAISLNSIDAFEFQKKFYAMQADIDLRPYRCGEDRPVLKSISTGERMGTISYLPISENLKTLKVGRVGASLESDTINLPFEDSTIVSLVYKADKIRLTLDTDTAQSNCARAGGFRELYLFDGYRVESDSKVLVSSNHLLGELNFKYDKKYFYSGAVTTLKANDTISFNLPEVPPDSLSCMIETTGLNHEYDSAANTMTLFLSRAGTYDFLFEPCNPCVVSCFFPPDSIYNHFEFNTGTTEHLGHMLNIEDYEGWLDMTAGSKMVICENIVCENKDSITMIGVVDFDYSKPEQFMAAYRDIEGAKYRDPYYIGSDVANYWRLVDRTMIIVENNGALVLDSLSYTEIGSGSSIYIKPGGTLKIESGAHVVIGGETIGFGEIIADDSSFVCIEPGAIVEFYNDTLDTSDRHIFYISQNPLNPSTAGVAPGSNASAGNCIDHCAIKDTFPDYGIGHHERGWFNVGKPLARFEPISVSCNNHFLNIYGQTSLNESRHRIEVCKYDTVNSICTGPITIIPDTTVDSFFAGRMDVVDILDWLPSASKGVHRVTLIVENDCEDSDSYSENIILYEEPVAAVTADTLICGGTGLLDAVGSTSTGDFTSYTWEVYQYVPLPDYLTVDTAWDAYVVTIDTIYTDSIAVVGSDTVILDSLKILTINYDTSYYHTLDTSAFDTTKYDAYFQQHFDTTFSGNTVDTFDFPGYYFRPGTKYAIVLHLQGYCDIDSDTLWVRTHDGPSISAGPDKHVAATVGGVWIPKPTLEGTASGHTGTPTWTPTLGLTPSSSLIPKADPTSTTTYVLSAVDAEGCYAYDTVTVFVNTTANAGRDTLICHDDSVQVGTPAVGSYNYEWSPASLVSNASIAQPYAYTNYGGTHLTLKITDNHSDFLEYDHVTITRDTIDKPAFAIQPGQTFYYAQFQVQYAPIAATSLDWDFDDGTGSHTGKSTIFEHQYPPVPSAQYDVCVSHTNACGLQELCKLCEFNHIGQVIPNGNPTGLEQEENPRIFSVTVVPNPFSDIAELRYRMPEHPGQKQMEVTDITGRVLMSQSFDNIEGVLPIDLSQYSEGVYLYRVIAADGLIQSGEMILVK